MATFTNRGKDKEGKEIWYIRVFVDGKQKGFTFHGSERSARREAANAENRRQQGETVTPSRMKVADYLNEWMETYQKQEVNKRCYYNHSSLVRVHIIPAIGDKRMSTLSPMECQKIINKLGAEGKTRTAVIVFNLMKKAFRKAVELGSLVKNPMDVVTKPRDRAQERPALSIEQAVIFLEAAKEDSLYALLAFLTLTGARPEEAMGVKWEDVNFDKRIVSFRRAVKRIPGGGWEFDELKTADSETDFPLNDRLVEILHTHKREQAKMRLSMGEDWTDNKLAFTNTVGNPVDIVLARKHVAKILERADLPPVRLYDLRHSFGSALLESGEDIKTVSRLMRHASINTTARYVHGHANRDRRAVDRLGQVFEQTNTPNKPQDKPDVQ
ncbi:MAG: tyrosine-type recombinase/integrase [Bacilli bacterium]